MNITPRDARVLGNFILQILKLLHDVFLYDESLKFLPQPYTHAC